MTFPLQISFRNLAHNDEIEARIKEKASKLERFSKQIITCRIVVEVPHRSHVSGNPYDITVDISVPGKEIVVRPRETHDEDKKDINMAIKDSFEAAERQLEEYMRIKRGA